MHINELKEMMAMQSHLEELIGNDMHSQAFKNEMALALSCEIHEALGETPWKPWKKNQEYNHEKFKEELVDCWAFLINLTLSSDMGHSELYERFRKKYLINIKRQQEGY